MKSNKKWMLVVLTLLALVALPLVGCKNDSVSEQTSGQSGEGEPRWLTFTSDKETHLQVSFEGSIGVPTGMQYSTDRSIWKDFTKETTVITFGKDTGEKYVLYLRGKSSTGTATSRDNYVNFTFKENTKVSASGDIRTLVDWENPANADTSNAKFCSLFKDCTQLVTAPKLPATTLADSCYRNMFEDCKNLTKAPELPATALTQFCYLNMFYGCTSLETAPELEATTLAASCYNSMFYGCKGLTTAPELKATTLAGGCYENMFLGCTKLSSVTMLATNVSATRALQDWLRGTAENGTLYVDSTMVKDDIIKDSLPSGKNWTVKDVKDVKDKTN